MDFMKMAKASLLPAGLIIVIGLVASMIGVIPVIGLVGGLIGLLAFFVLNPIIMAWAGFKWSKDNGMDLAGSAITGGFAGLIASIVGGIINLVLSTLSGGATSGGTGAAIGAAFSIIGIVVMVPVYTIGGLICGAIGGFLSDKIGAPAKSGKK